MECSHTRLVHIVPDFDWSCLLSQSVASPPLAAPAQTWRLKTANMNICMASTAAATSAWVLIGLALLVSSIQQLEPRAGSQNIHFVPQKAVAARVSVVVADRCLLFI